MDGPDEQRGRSLHSDLPNERISARDDRFYFSHEPLSPRHISVDDNDHVSWNQVSGGLGPFPPDLKGWGELRQFFDLENDFSPEEYA